jgi:magnesium transporter
MAATRQPARQSTESQEMIKAQMQLADGTWSEGGEELVERWRQEAGAYLWVDLEDEPATGLRVFLKNMGCHPLAIDDVLRYRNPPKVHDYDNYTLILYRGLPVFNADLTNEQQNVAMFAGERCLITVHKMSSYTLSHYWAAARTEGLLPSPGLLATRMIRHATASYLDVLLSFEPLLTDLEDTLQEQPCDPLMRELITYQSRLRRLRRIFDYHERLVENLRRDIPQRLIDEDGDIDHALQDLFERCERTHSLCNMYYEICGDLLKGYLSVSSHALNNTMQVLTIITALFLPLTLIAGIYGMNFENMPELHWRYGYFTVLGVMIALLGVTGTYAWKKWM